MPAGGGAEAGLTAPAGAEGGLKTTQKKARKERREARTKHVAGESNEPLGQNRGLEADPEGRGSDLPALMKAASSPWEQKGFSVNGAGCLVEKAEAKFEVELASDSVSLWRGDGLKESGLFWGLAPRRRVAGRSSRWEMARPAAHAGRRPGGQWEGVGLRGRPPAGPVSILEHSPHPKLAGGRRVPLA